MERNNDRLSPALGWFGFVVLEPADATTAASLEFCAIKALNADAAVTANCIAVNINADTSFAETINTNDTVYGRFTEIDVVSGKVMAYFNKG